MNEQALKERLKHIARDQKTIFSRDMEIIAARTILGKTIPLKISK